MREILFRGKKYNGEWTYGYYVQADYSWHGYGRHKEWLVCSARSNGGWFALQEKHAVIPETIGQYTGLTDKNGTKIFEGDITTVPLSWDGDDVMDVGRVFYSKQSCGFYRTSKAFGGVFGVASGLSGIGTDEYEVIGNIYDNPELIGGEVNG